MFINEDFMLHSKVARELYNSVKDLPIIDYHCHLSPKQLSDNEPFRNAFDLFLGGDHYKWRQMRTAGIPEEMITGDAPDYDKFEQFATMMPYLIGNPLYHWTHLELLRYFGVTDELCARTSKKIWDIVNERLATPAFLPQSLVEKSHVEVICTTDDPADTLIYHEKLHNFSAKVLPTFRPDKVTDIAKDSFLSYIEAAGVQNYAQLLDWLTARIVFFDMHGCRLADHSIERAPYAEGDAAAIFEKRMNGEPISEKEAAAYKCALLQHCAKAYAAHGWVMQLHIGAMRNNNTAMFQKIGADTGFDSIADFEIAQSLSRFLDSLAVCDALPKTILYPLNPKDNYVIGSLIGNFQQGPGAGKMQFGSGWWFNDQRDGMENQMRALANLGMLSKFVGMLTDSRSFVSYPRHEYFRRILCNLLGTWVENGEYPRDMATLTEIAQNICYYNAKQYFSF